MILHLKYVSTVPGKFYIKEQKMKLKSRVSLIIFLIFSLACYPTLATLNEPKVETQNPSTNSNSLRNPQKQQRKGLGFKSRTSPFEPKSKVLFERFKIRRSTQRRLRVQQKQRRQGFWNTFKFQSNRGKR
ncbi:MAG: hypothetical protein IGS39_06770 [Calothrix sp. C42_A2020_038]|nr:hypothetical protein [Calothrix sp. C42_A2020_038]